MEILFHGDGGQEQWGLVGDGDTACGDGASPVWMAVGIWTGITRMVGEGEKFLSPHNKLFFSMSR